MKMGFAIVAGVLLASVVLAGFVLPKHVNVARRIVIDAAPEHVWPDVGSLATWPEWTEWNTQNDSKYDPKPVGTAKLTWTDSEGGPGEQTIIESDPAKGMKYRIELQGGKYVVEGRVQFVKDGSKTAVTWIDSMSFAHSYVGRYFGAFMDQMMGPKVEKSLLALKRRSEERAHGGANVAVVVPPAVVKPEEPKVPGEATKPVEEVLPPPPVDVKEVKEVKAPPPAEEKKPAVEEAKPVEVAKPVEAKPPVEEKPVEPGPAEPPEAKPEPKPEEPKADAPAP